MRKYVQIVLCFIYLFSLTACKNEALDFATSTEKINEVKGASEEAEETIIYNGKEYKKSELCNDTLYWLELSEEERIASSYMPPEFMEFIETWGVTLVAEDVTPTSLTIKCTQSGGEVTGELQTGSWFVLESWTQEDGWKEVDYVPQKYDVAWTEEAWKISTDATTEWKVNWEWLYGKLPAGKYRIGKEIMDFRATGDYNTMIYFAEFNIEAL